MHNIDFPRTIPDPPAGAVTTYDLLSDEGKQLLEQQGLRTADLRELTQRLVALEMGHQHVADHATACGLMTDNLRAEVNVILEHKQQQIDALRATVDSLRAEVSELRGLRVA